MHSALWVGAAELMLTCWRLPGISGPDFMAIHLIIVEIMKWHWELKYSLHYKTSRHKLYGKTWMFNEDKVSPCYRTRLKRSHVLSANNRNTERLSDRLYGETAFVPLDKKKVRELPSDFHNAQTQTRWHERTDDESRACVTECLLSRYALTMTLMEWPAARKGRKKEV